MENLRKEKQIEELTKDLYGYSIDTEEDAAYVAKILIDKGYREASEVAREIIDTLKSAGIDEWRYPVIAELKKKYEVKIDE